MSSVKLTKSMREQILKSMMRYRFNKDATNLAIDIIEFSHKVYNDVYSQSEQHTMYSLPDGWLPSSRDIQVKFSSEITELNFSRANLYRQSVRNINQYLDKNDAKLKQYEGVIKLVLYKHRETYANRPAKLYDVAHPLYIEYEHLTRRIEMFNQTVNRAETAAESALNSVTTTNKLVEVWPEVEPFVADVTQQPIKSNLPAVQISKLNAAFDLPVPG